MKRLLTVNLILALFFCAAYSQQTCEADEHGVSNCEPPYVCDARLGICVNPCPNDLPPLRRNLTFTESLDPNLGSISCSSYFSELDSTYTSLFDWVTTQDNEKYCCPITCDSLYDCQNINEYAKCRDGYCQTCNENQEICPPGFGQQCEFGTGKCFTCQSPELRHTCQHPNYCRLVEDLRQYVCMNCTEDPTICTANQRCDLITATCLTCLDDPTLCSSPNFCSPTGRCLNCTRLPTACTYPNYCIEGVCKNCTAHPSLCTAPNVCQDGYCRNCTTDSSLCRAPGVCNQEGVCETSTCLDHGDCPSGSACDDGVCVQAPLDWYFVLDGSGVEPCSPESANCPCDSICRQANNGQFYCMSEDPNPCSI